jgi:hypothetical protein
MAFPSTISPAMFSTLAITNLTGLTADVFKTYTAATNKPATSGSVLPAGLHTFFDTATGTPITDTKKDSNGALYLPIDDIREFPAMGIPPNIVNVPVYGQSTSSQVQGQADAPNLEIQINYIGSKWDAAGTLGILLRDKTFSFFRFVLANERLTGTQSTVGDMGSKPNAIWYWGGKLEAMTVQPSLTDAVIATLTISVQTNIEGPYTVDP